MARLTLIAALLPAAACGMSGDGPGQQVGSGGCQIYLSGGVTASSTQTCSAFATLDPDAGVVFGFISSEPSYGTLTFAATLPGSTFATGTFGTTVATGSTAFVKAATTLTEGSEVWLQSLHGSYPDTGSATLTISSTGTVVTSGDNMGWSGASGQITATLSPAPTGANTVMATIDF